MKTPPNLFRLLLLTGLFTTGLLPQQNYNANPDSAKEKPTQYRRTIELNKNYQSYEEKYRGEDLEKVKSSQFPLSGTGVWTELNPKVPRVTYFGIHFFNKDTGWAVGDLGALIKTTDGGLSWKVIQTNTTKPLLKVRSYNGQIVIATGYDGLILRSTDGGETFVHILSRLGTMFDLWGLELINDTVGWVCGATALLKTTDGGENWQRVNTPGYTGNMWWIDFLNEQYGFVAADGKVLRTTDGGNNWEVLQAGDNRPLYSIDVIDSQHIAAAGHGGTNFRGKNIYSSDGGYTWADGAPLTFEAVNDIKYTDRDTGYLVMDEVGFYKTTNRGQSWVHVTNAIGEYELSIVSHNIGYSAGTSLKIYKAEGNLESWRKLILNEDFADVFFINEYKGFVITSAGQGKVFKTENGGVSWQLAVGAPGGGDILFIDSVTGFIGSSNSNIYKTTNGGQSWYPTNGVPNIIAKIQFINSQIGWAAGGFVIIKTTDGGENWVTQVTIPADHFTSLYFVDSVNGWATSRYIWQTTNGGVNWINRTDIPSFFSKDVYFTQIDTGFIINRSLGNNLISTKDGGLTWQIDSTIDAGYNFCYFPNKYHWIVNGVHQKWETYNNGLHWNNITPALPWVINNFHSPNDWIGYAVGGAGLILQYEDSSFLPVELLTFQGSFENDETVKLLWMTASELNNMGFEIQKSFNKEHWITIGFIRGKGTSTEVNNYTFFDSEIKSGIHYYRLKQIDYGGSFSYSTIISMISEFKPPSFKLSQNYPNPFNSRTLITYQVPIKSFISFSLYNLKGERITELLSEEKETGLYQLAINNLTLPSGIYFIRMKTSHGFTAMIKITLIK